MTIYYGNKMKVVTIPALDYLKSAGYAYNRSGMCYGIAWTTALSLINQQYDDYLRILTQQQDADWLSGKSSPPQELRPWLESVIYYFCFYNIICR